MRDRIATVGGAALFGVLGCAAFIKAGSYTMGGANVFPQTVAAAMVVCAAGLVLTEVLRGGKPRAATEALEDGLDVVGPRMLWAILLSAIYVAVIPYLGLGTASFLLIAGGSWSLGLRRPVVVLAGAAIFALIVPWMFRHFLHIRPPAELLATIFAGG